MADGEAPDANQPVGKEVGFAVDDEVRALARLATPRAVPRVASRANAAAAADRFSFSRIASLARSRCSPRAFASPPPRTSAETSRSR